MARVVEWARLDGLVVSDVGLRQGISNQHSAVYRACDVAWWWVHVRLYLSQEERINAGCEPFDCNHTGILARQPRQVYGSLLLLSVADSAGDGSEEASNATS